MWLRPTNWLNLNVNNSTGFTGKISTTEQIPTSLSDIVANWNHCQTSSRLFPGLNHPDGVTQSARNLFSQSGTELWPIHSSQDWLFVGLKTKMAGLIRIALLSAFTIADFISKFSGPGNRSRFFLGIGNLKCKPSILSFGDSIPRTENFRFTSRRFSELGIPTFENLFFVPQFVGSFADENPLVSGFAGVCQLLAWNVRGPVFTGITDEANVSRFVATDVKLDIRRWRGLDSLYLSFYWWIGSIAKSHDVGYYIPHSGAAAP